MNVVAFGRSRSSYIAGSIITTSCVSSSAKGKIEGKLPDIVESGE